MALTSLWPAVSSAANAQLFQLKKPAFEVLTKTDAFELRSYQPMVLAELVVQSDVTTAGKEGSQMIKVYLFRQGAYKPVEVGQRGSEKIAMTARASMEKTAEKFP